MPLDRIVAIAVLAISVAVVLYFLPGGIGALRNSIGTGTRRQQDAAGREPDPDPEMVTRIHALETIGYRRIGATLTQVPGGHQPAWILASEDALSYAILVQGSASITGLTGLYSAWPDGTWLGTIHPRGTPLAFRSLRLRVESGSLGQAAAVHREEVARIVSDRGAPTPVRTLGDMLALDADYRIRFGGRELRPFVVRALAPVGIGLAMMILSLAWIARP